MKGYIATFNNDRGYGFIRLADKKFSHVFFHITKCLCEPKPNLAVQFEIAEGAKGPVAINVDTLDAATGAIESLSGGQQ